VRLARHHGGAAVFVAALAVPVDDAALLLAWALRLRGGPAILGAVPRDVTGVAAG
jgi:hypothetical protein